MSKAKMHPFEDARIADIIALQIFDSTEEKAFDDLTVLAAEICETPIAAISIVDSKTQSFKSRIGLAIKFIPRDFSFCAHAILQLEPLIVEDASLDPRFSNSLYVNGSEHLRFYAGVQLLSVNGLPIGTLNVMDTVARSLTVRQINSLKKLASQASHLLELKLRLISLEEEKKHVAIKAAAIENLSEGVVVRDSDGAVVEFNPAALHVLGLSAEQLIGMSAQDPRWKIVYEDGCHVSSDNFPTNICLRTGLPMPGTVVGIHRPSGDFCWVKINAVPLFLSGKASPSHVVTSFEDVSRQRYLNEQQTALQLQLSESARLSTLGEMAGGIAHEINNPLAIISGKINRLQTKLETAEIPREDLNSELSKLETGVERIAKIVRGLRMYARDAGTDEFVTTDLQIIAEETIALCSERFRHNSVILKFNCVDALLIDCRPAQVSQILMNLLSNAFDATANLTDKWVELDIAVDNQFAVATVTDSGHGIEEETLTKMMQPFFTTKEVGKGTGLGLSISKGLAQVHGGDLNYVRGGLHTKFTLAIPLSTKHKAGQVV